jgi:hypothetical protein
MELQSGGDYREEGETKQSRFAQSDRRRKRRRIDSFSAAQTIFPRRESRPL